jgi:hypothetical protein
MLSDKAVQALHDIRDNVRLAQDSNGSMRKLEFLGFRSADRSGRNGLSGVARRAIVPAGPGAIGKPIGAEQVRYMSPKIALTLR